MDVFSYLPLAKASCASLSAKAALGKASDFAESMDLEHVTPGHVLLEVLVHTPSFTQDTERLAGIGLTADALEQCVRGMSSQSSRSDGVTRCMFGYAAELAEYRDDKLGQNQAPMFLVVDLVCACIASGDAAIETLIQELGLSVFDVLVGLGAPEDFTAQFFPFDDVAGFEKALLSSYTGSRD